MKKSFTLKTLGLLVVLFCSISATLANDVIKFQWNVMSGGEYEFQVSATEGKSFTVDWGDGSEPDTYTGNESGEFILYKYGEDGDYNVTIAALTPDCSIEYFVINNIPIKNLDLTGAPMLKGLFCVNTQLTYLDISKNDNLNWMDCYDNMLTLSNLYIISQKVKGTERALGTQTLPSEKIDINENINISSELSLGGVNTLLTVTKLGGKAIEGVDYEIESASCYFKTAGFYTIEMTNEAIISNTYHPAKVVKTYTVGDIEPQKISFTANVSYSLSIQVAAPMDKTYKVNWGDGKEETYTGTDWGQYCRHYYGGESEKEYTITITGNEADCFFKTLSISSTNATSLDVSKAYTLENLYCSSNKLKKLDVSYNSSLRNLSCSSNELEELNLTGCTALWQIQCYYNNLSILDLSTCSQASAIYCYNNQLIDVLLHDEATLSNLECQNNQLPLSSLYAMSQKFGGYVSTKILSPQILPSSNITLESPINLTGNMEFDSKATNIAVTKLGGSAILNKDYSLTGSVLRFKTNGIYEVVMSNETITSQDNTPAEVRKIYIVGSVPEQEISFTKSYFSSEENCYANFNITATQGMTFTVDWGNGAAPEVHTGTGSSQYINGTVNCNQPTITIKGTHPNCFFTTFSGSGIKSIDVSKCTMLKELAVSGDIQELDLSKNNVLETLNCYSNKLADLDVSNNPYLQSLSCGNNQLAVLDLSKNNKLNS